MRDDAGDSIGARVRALREARGWSKVHLAMAAGVSERTVRRIEDGKSPSFESLQALAAAFCVDVADLRPGAAAVRVAPSMASQISIDAPTAPTHAGREHEDATRAAVLQWLLVNDMIGWRKQSIFAAAPEVIGLDRMLLEDFYVEPIVRIGGKPRSACGLIRQLVGEHALVVVSAPYGHGKSLTARMLASTLAGEWAEGERPRSECWYPIYVPLGLHASSARDLDVDLLIRRATKARARALGYDLELADACHALPERPQRSLVILDGLDEVHFGLRDVEDLFHRLCDQSSSGRRFAVFTRPEVLPTRVSTVDIARIELEAFDSRQVARWLDAWNKTFRPADPITYKDLEARGFHHIARIPIILFLTAFCWDPLIAGASSDEASLYAHFARRLIEGKLAETRERQPRVDGVVDQLVPALSGRGLLADVAPPADRREALMWLMGRIAWSDHVMEHIEQRELTEQDVRDVVAEELKISEFDPQSYRVTLLLGQQRDEAPARRSIFFGHRSFREFFVACHWFARLREWLKFPARRADIESELLRGPLLMQGSGCLRFLRLMLARLDADVRAGIAAWGREVFERDELRWTDQRRELSAERGASLRNVGLALLCEATDTQVPVASARIRSMLAGMWATDRWETLWAPRIVCPELDLSGVRIAGANLSGAELRGATFYGAKVNQADLRKLKAPLANMGHADFSSVDMSEAIVHNANLDHTNFSNANLSRACLRDCHVEGATFVNADLRRTDLSKTEFEGVTFAMADLRDADLSGAVLKAVDLENTNLAGASLAGARLIGCNLLEATLIGADLRGADLSLVRDGLVVGECVFQGTRYDARTIWPDGFEASPARGLVFAPD